MPKSILQIDRKPSAGQEPSSDISVAALIHTVGDRVRTARKTQRLSRRELSERSGVSVRYLAQLEGGEGNISIGLLQRLAIALKQPVETFMRPHSSPSIEVDHVASLYLRADAATKSQVLKILDPVRMRAQKAERICLVGLRGAGKSTLGALLSLELGVPFIELNSAIEESAGIAIGEIIALYGQEGYRQLEADTLIEIIASNERAVVAVAGGIVTEAATFQQVLSRFHTVWIKTTPSEHMERVRAQGDMRPMAGNPQAMVQLLQILKTREALYAQADYQLDTNGKAVEASHSELSGLINEQQIITKSGN